MKKFDFANFIGRILLSLYFITNSLLFFWETYSIGIEYTGNGFWSGITMLEFISGVMLLLGAKPRVAAGVLGFFILIKIIVVIGGLGTTPWEIYASDKVSTMYENMSLKTWVSYYGQFLFGKIAVLGACLFMVGTRTIPHSVFARSENNLKNKYGL